MVDNSEFIATSLEIVKLPHWCFLYLQAFQIDYGFYNL